ncbi:MAG: hypothetical protein ACYDB1_09565 [Acidiferrobacteraceae bacterium]
MTQELNLPTEPTMPDDRKGWRATRLGAIAWRERILFARLCYDDMGTGDDVFEQGRANGTLYSNSYFEHASQEALEEYLEEENSVPVRINDYGSGGIRLDVTYKEGANAVWVPDEDALDNIKDGTSSLQDYAKGVLEEAEDYANGNVYGYQVEVFDLITRPDGSAVEAIDAYEVRSNQDADSCWGFVGDEGFEEAKRQMEEAAQHLAKGEGV